LNEFDSTATSSNKNKKEDIEVVSTELEDEMSKLVDSLNLHNHNHNEKNVYENIQELLHKQKEGEEDLLPGDLAIKEDDLNGLIDSMMSQLLSKDVLYEPLKELSIKYPQYIKGNDTYRKQYEITLKLVKIFESSNSEEKDSGRVQELLEELQALGSPPVELMDSMVNVFFSKEVYCCFCV
jgi:peroxin-19